MYSPATPSFTPAPAKPTPARSLLGLCAAAILLFAGSLPAAAAEEERKTPADRVIKLTLPIGGKAVATKLFSYNTITFSVQTADGKTHSVLWNAIPAKKVDQYWRFLEEPAKDADKLFELGDLLIRHHQGQALAEKAFKEALALDPSLKDAIERSREGKSPDGTPRFVGTADPKKWGKLSDETMKQGVATLQAFCKKTQQTLNKNMRVFESKRFMVMTDLDAKRIQPLLPKLRSTYTRVSQLLGENPFGNIFLGKCLIVIFDKRIDYIRFQKEMHDTDARGTGGLCHGFGDGHAHVAVVASKSQKHTNHVVCHELVHAYLHRLASPVPLDDWVNEGLAEYIAHQVEPPSKKNIYVKVRLLLQGKDDLGKGFFEKEGLKPSQYSTAHALTAYLFERGKHAYPLFIKAIKDGKATDKALANVYKMTPKSLTKRFMRRLDREINKKLGG